MNLLPTMFGRVSQAVEMMENVSSKRATTCVIFCVVFVCEKLLQIEGCSSLM